MRIKVVGDCDSARALIGNLRKAGYVVTDHYPSFTIFLSETDVEHIGIDSVDSELERHVINAIAELIEKPLVLFRAGGIRSDQQISLIIPRDEGSKYAVEIGVMRGIDRTVQSNYRPLESTPVILPPVVEPPPTKPSLFRRFFS